MILKEKWLVNRSACVSGIDWFVNEAKSKNDVAIIAQLIEEDKFVWANWFVTKRFVKKVSKVKYAVFAAELVLDIFEKKYPKDERPRKAIKAISAWVENPSKEARRIADAAAAAAYAAAYDAAAYAAAAADAADDDVKRKIIKNGIDILISERTSSQGSKIGY